MLLRKKNPKLQQHWKSAAKKQSWEQCRGQTLAAEAGAWDEGARRAKSKGQLKRGSGEFPIEIGLDGLAAQSSPAVRWWHLWISLWGWNSWQAEICSKGAEAVWPGRHPSWKWTPWPQGLGKGRGFANALQFIPIHCSGNWNGPCGRRFNFQWRVPAHGLVWCTLCGQCCRRTQGSPCPSVYCGVFMWRQASCTCTPRKWSTWTWNLAMFSLGTDVAVQVPQPWSVISGLRGQQAWKATLSLAWTRLSLLRTGVLNAPVCECLGDNYFPHVWG